jgi:hypothetical protein
LNYRYAAVPLSAPGYPDISQYITLPNLNTAFSFDSLTKNVQYAVYLIATNAAGNSVRSDAVVATAATVSDPPTITSVVGANQSVQVTILPGNSNSSSITDYLYAIQTIVQTTPLENVTPISLNTTNTTFVVSGLTNGISYNLAIVARNQIGLSGLSNIVVVTPKTVPSPPSVTNIVAKNNKATITIQPGYAGGTPITSMFYVLNGGSRVNIAMNTVFQLDQLLNCNVYTLRLGAINEVGTSALSDPYEFVPFYSAVELPLNKRPHVPKWQLFSLYVQNAKGKAKQF